MSHALPRQWREQPIENMTIVNISIVDGPSAMSDLCLAVAHSHADEPASSSVGKVRWSEQLQADAAFGLVTTGAMAADDVDDLVEQCPTLATVGAVEPGFEA